METLAVIYLAGFAASSALCISQRKGIIVEVMKDPVSSGLPAWVLGLAMAAAVFFVAAVWPAHVIFRFIRKP